MGDVKVWTPRAKWTRLTVLGMISGFVFAALAFSAMYFVLSRRVLTPRSCANAVTVQADGIVTLGFADGAFVVGTTPDAQVELRWTGTAASLPFIADCWRIQIHDLAVVPRRVSSFTPEQQKEAVRLSLKKLVEFVRSDLRVSSEIVIPPDVFPVTQTVVIERRFWLLDSARFLTLPMLLLSAAIMFATGVVWNMVTKLDKGHGCRHCGYGDRREKGLVCTECGCDTAVV